MRTIINDTFSSMPSLLCLNGINSPILCHNIANRDLDTLSLPQGVILAHYTDDNILIGSTEKLLINNSGLKLCVHQRRGISFIKIQKPSSAKLSTVYWCGNYRGIPLKVKGKFLHLVLPNTKNEA